jgi:hypothetical protein
MQEKTKKALDNLLVIWEQKDVCVIRIEDTRNLYPTEWVLRYAIECQAVDVLTITRVTDGWDVTLPLRGGDKNGL